MIRAAKARGAALWEAMTSLDLERAHQRELSDAWRQPTGCLSHHARGAARFRRPQAPAHQASSELSRLSNERAAAGRYYAQPKPSAAAHWQHGPTASRGR
jgi:hypothetical protein